MSDLDRARGFIARGDKENAIPLLASVLLGNRDEIEAWLLLGDMVDDGSRKKYCYEQVLRLSPNSLDALTRLQDLGVVLASDRETANSKGAQTGDEDSVQEAKQASNYLLTRNSYSPVDHSRDGLEIIGYVVGGIVAFIIILYVIASPGSTSIDSDTLILGLIFLSLIVVILVLTVSSKNRS